MKKDIPKGFYKISVKALIFDEDRRFLLAKEETGMWEFLGGKLESGEEPKKALKREINEEAGLEIISIADQPSHFFTFISANDIPFANVLYEVKLKDLNFIPSDECIDLQFFTKEQALKEKLYVNVKKFLEIYN